MWLKTKLLLLSFLMLTFYCDAQNKSIPKKYVPLKEVLGDLDKDGIDEKVVVYDMTDQDEDGEGIDRELIIFKRKGNDWIIWKRSTQAVGGSKDGGMMGDPFEDIKIEKGILTIVQFGGSSWKWSHIDKYRFQSGEFELIGYTSSYGKPCEYWEETDYNLITGNISSSKEYEPCEDKKAEGEDEYEKFNHKLKKRILLQNRTATEIKIITPKYRREIYL